MNRFENNKKITIGIIDSGLDASITDSDKDNIVFSGHVFKTNDGVFIENNNSYDQIGHGTAIYSIINKKLSSINSINYVIIKIFDYNLMTDVESLVCAIDKCVDEKCDIVNISAVIINENSRLEEACKKAYDKNIKIIAAESNFSSDIALPAHYKTCYGVKSGKCHGAYDYYFDNSAESQFIARGDEQRITWLNKSQLFMGGASFAAAHVTAFVALVIKDNAYISRNEFEQHLIKNSLATPPPLVPLSQESKLNLFIDSDEMQAEAVSFLNWNKHNEKYKMPVVLSKGYSISGKRYLLADDLKQIPDGEYDSVFVDRDFQIDNHEDFENALIANNKYLYYLYSDYERNNKRKNQSFLIDDFNFDLSFVEKHIKIERHLFNYTVKAPILGMISAIHSTDHWNKAYLTKSLFEADGYKVVIFDTTSHRNMFGADTSCCCSDEKDLISDYSNYKRVLSLFIKCLDYHYNPDIIIVVGRISLTKDSMINRNPNSIIQSCAVIFACLMEAFVAYDHNSIIDNQFINNLEVLSKGKFIGFVNNNNIDNIYKQVKAYFS